MVSVNNWAILVAAVAAFVVSSLWYMLFGRQRAKLRGTAVERRPAVGKVFGELGRNLVIAYVLAHLVVLIGIPGWPAGAKLGVWLWIGFPLMILIGSVIWENVPWKLAAIHSGDWLVKLLLMAVILAVWR